MMECDDVQCTHADSSYDIMICMQATIST